MFHRNIASSIKEYVESQPEQTFIYLFIYLFICLFINSFVYLLIYLFIYLSIYLFTYLFICASEICKTFSLQSYNC